MPETLTESFCERCGTRYSFAAAPKPRRLGRLKVLSKGLANFVMSDDASLDDALADARIAQDSERSEHQLDAFHQTFQFCLGCRQYTCPNCWNLAQGRCQSCAPLPGQGPLEGEPLLATRLAGLAGVIEFDSPAASGNGHEPTPVIDASAWPSVDLSRTPTSPAGTNGMVVTPVAPEVVAPAAASELTAPEGIPTIGEVIGDETVIANEPPATGERGSAPQAKPMSAAEAPAAEAAGTAEAASTDELPTAEAPADERLATEPALTAAEAPAAEPTATTEPTLTAEPAATTEPALTAAEAPAAVTPADVEPVAAVASDAFDIDEDVLRAVAEADRARKEAALARSALLGTEEGVTPPAPTLSTPPPSPSTGPLDASAALDAGPAFDAGAALETATPSDAASSLEAATPPRAETSVGTPVVTSATEHATRAAELATGFLARFRLGSRTVPVPPEPAAATAIEPGPATAPIEEPKVDQPSAIVAPDESFGRPELALETSIAEPAVAAAAGSEAEPSAVGWVDALAEPIDSAELEPAASNEPTVGAAPEADLAAPVEPAPVEALTPRPIDLVAQPVWQIVAPDVVPPETAAMPPTPAVQSTAPEPTQALHVETIPAAPIPAAPVPTTPIQPGSIPAALASGVPTAPVSSPPSATPIQTSAAPSWPASRPPGPASRPGATASTGRQGDVWELSSQVLLGHSSTGVQECVSCGLPLSSTARFCRRCGTAQH